VPGRSMDQLEKAVRRARYNETVHVTVENEQGESEEVCLVPTIVPGGSIEFQRLEGNANSMNILVRELQTNNRWFLPMLNDTKRNELYDECIRKHIGKNGGPPPIVLEIGSGTGLLSLLAVKHGARHVTTVEMSTPQSRIARATIAANTTTTTQLVDDDDDDVDANDGRDVSGRGGESDDARLMPIELRNEHSMEMAPLRPLAQLCISELLEDGLLGESWLPTLRDAWARHLTSDAIVIPSRAGVYGQFVYFDHQKNGSSTTTSITTSTSTLPSSTTRTTNADDIVLGTVAPTTTDDSSSSASIFNHDNNLLETTGHVLPVHTTKLFQSGVLQLASDVFSLFDFDVSSPELIPPPSGRHRTISCDLLRRPANAVMVWWKLGLDVDTWYELDPHDLQQGHWHPCLHFIPPLSGSEEEGKNVVKLHASHDDERITIRLLKNHMQDDDNNNDDEEGPPLAKKSRTVAATDQQERIVPVVTIGRTLQLGLSGRIDRLRDAIRATMPSSRRDEDDDNLLVLDVSDFPIAGCLAAKLGARRIVSMESSSSDTDLPTHAAHMVQLANRLDHVVDVVRCYPESLTVASFGGGNSSVGLVVAEPYYEMLEGWHLAEGLHLYGILQTLRTNGVVTNKTRVVPGSCQVRACLIERPLLRSAYRPCGDQQQHIHGIDHSFVNDLAWSPQFPVVSIPMWQYDYSVLSEPFDIGFLSYSAPESSVMTMSVTPRIIQHGRCDALMVWVQYNCDSGASVDPIWSTDGFGHNQLVQMIQEPFEVTPTKSSSSSGVVCQSTIGPMVNGKECHHFQIGLETSSR
jgi:type III protein arginine methyltransferase